MIKDAHRGRGIAVDPGKRSAGVSVFNNGLLEDMAFIRADGPIEVIAGVLSWFGSSQGLDWVCTEGQQVYGRGVGNPNDLLPLSFVCGGIQSVFDVQKRFMPLPRQWKGSVPKEIFARRIMLELTPEELKIFDEKKKDIPKSLLHNVVDAIGLGLYAVGRMKK